MKKEIVIKYKQGKSYREKAVIWFLDKVAPVHRILCGNREAWNLNLKDFLSYPESSLGHNLGLFYQHEGFEPIALAERHDVFHVLLGYSTNVYAEAAMQFFLLGNGKVSPFTLGTCLLSATLFPTRITYFLKEYKKGRCATNISKWDFRALLHVNTTVLQQFIF